MTSRKQPSQRNLENTTTRTGNTLQSMAPGTAGGRVTNAAPVKDFSTAPEPSTAGPVEILFSWQGFPIPGVESPRYPFRADALITGVTVTWHAAGSSTSTVALTFLRGSTNTTDTTSAVVGGSTGTNSVFIDYTVDPLPVSLGDMLSFQFTTANGIDTPVFQVWVYYPVPEFD